MVGRTHSACQTRLPGWKAITDSVHWLKQRWDYVFAWLRPLSVPANGILWASGQVWSCNEWQGCRGNIWPALFDLIFTALMKLHTPTPLLYLSLSCQASLKGHHTGSHFWPVKQETVLALCYCFNHERMFFSQLVLAFICNLQVNSSDQRRHWHHYKEVRNRSLMIKQVLNKPFSFVQVIRKRKWWWVNLIPRLSARLCWCHHASRSTQLNWWLQC